jgi:DNA-binding response OmpR family regulator
VGDAKTPYLHSIVGTVLKKPRLLMIEDNPDTRQIYKDVFEREGFQVLLAEDGEKGLSFAQSTLPDVILLDLMLPKLHGFDILKRLRAEKETQNLPVVIFSAMADSADRQKAVDLGVTEYSVKALNSPKQMVSRVRAILERAQQTTSDDPSRNFTVLLKETFADISRLQIHAGISEGFHCPQCQSAIVLSMMADPTRSPGHWFAAHFICSSCSRAF